MGWNTKKIVLFIVSAACVRGQTRQCIHAALENHPWLSKVCPLKQAAETMNKAKKILVIILITLLFGVGLSHAATDDEAAASQSMDDGSSPPNIGNFALPGPQQPGPLLSFGQTLIGRNHVQVDVSSFSPYHLAGPFDNINGSLTYGMTDTTSLYFNYPITSDPRSRFIRSTAIQDITLQLEHAFYTAGNRHYQEQATLVGAMTLPLEEATTVRFPKGFGSPAYFFGTTYNRTYVDWLVFFSPGVWLTTPSNHIRLGSQGLYQAGVGHSLLSVSEKSILFGLLELDGQYTKKDTVFGHALPNTGGNVVALTPSLSLAGQRFIAQVGVGFPMVQVLNGHQKKADYFIAADLTFTIA